MKSVPKRCSICRYSRFTDIEWASKKRFPQSSEAMGIPIQAWMTNNIALFYATWLLIHVQISMMVSPVSFSNSGPRATRQIWGIWKLRPAYSSEMPNLGQNRWCFVPCDLEIWWMTLENNRASLLCCFKLCATFHSHRWIQPGVTVRKRPIWVKFDNF